MDITKVFHKNTVISTQKSKAEVAAILSAETGAVSTSGKDFYGSFNEDGFEIRPTHIGRNSFNPVLYGKIKPTENGCDVEIEAKPTLFILPFLSFFTLISFFAFVFGVFDALNNGFTDENTGMLVLFPMLSVVVLVFRFVFSVPAENAFCCSQSIIIRTCFSGTDFCRYCVKMLVNTLVFTPLFPCINKNLPPEKSKDPKGSEFRGNFDSVSGLRMTQYERIAKTKN